LYEISMPIVRQLRHSIVRDLCEVQPAPAERLELEAAPSAQTVESYVLTRASERAWSTINRQLDQGGAFFWVHGGAGAGKTHFLNYLLALATRAGSLSAEPGRQLTCALEIAGVAREYEVESYILDALAEKLGADQSAAVMWRELRGVAALNVAIDAARRTGLRAITVVIDFSVSDYAGAAGYFRTLAEVAQNSKPVRFTVIAAGRGPAPAESRPLEVAPGDEIETAAVGIQRARRLVDQVSVSAAIDELYPSIDMQGLGADAIFPLHPSTVRTLAALLGPAPTVAAIARLARDAIIAAREAGSLARLIYPSDLMTVPTTIKLVETRLGDDGAEILAACRRLQLELHGNERELASQIVDTLALERVAGRSPLTLADLDKRVPLLADVESEHAWTRPLVTELLQRLAAASGGAIAFDGNSVRLDPDAVRVPEVALFNCAIALARRFDPTLSPARDGAELESRMKRLNDSMTVAVESATRTRNVLSDVLADAHIELDAQQSRIISDYISFAERGAENLLSAATDQNRRSIIVETIASYERLAGAGEVAPRLRMMREYLDRTGLKISHEVEPSKDSQVSALETECQLLRVELEPRILLGALKKLDALEARFQKFKWTYVQYYLGAHEQWRLEMNRLALLVSDLRRHSDALSRLNAIVALGPPEGAGLGARVSEAAARVVRCDLNGPLQPEVAPLCSSCGYVLGTISPRAELSDLVEQIEHALSIKLGTLSQGAIARIIREHDREHRLEGFLKITQAAQTDALTRVLDERLARYLAQLLDEGLGGAAPREPRGSLRRIDRDLKGPRLRSAPKPGAHN
jgi:hypothetical protein